MDNMKIDKPVLFFDLETTGLDTSKDRIVQVAAVKYTKGDKLYHFSENVNPGIPIPKEASDVHGLTNDDVKDCPKFREIAGHLYEYFEDAGTIAGYNIKNFDIPLLVEEFARCGIKLDLSKYNVLDVCEVFHAKEPRDLEGAVKFYLGEEIKDAHRAMADTIYTVRVLDAQIAKYGLPNTPADIVAEVRDPDAVDLAGKLVMKDGKVVINFGKHKGCALDDAPMSYKIWMVRNDVIGSDAVDLVRKSCGLDRPDFRDYHRGKYSA